MVEVDGATPLIGERGAITLLDPFEGTPDARRLLFHVAQRGEGGDPERHASEQIGSIGRLCHRRNEVGDRQLAPDLSTDAQITLTWRQREAPAAKGAAWRFSPGQPQAAAMLCEPRVRGTMSS
jgi:hypothetical protein